MTTLIQNIHARRELIVLALMLEFLHFSIWLDFGNPGSRSLMLIHLGLFLVWQPVWRSDEKISWQNSLIFFFLAIAIVAFMNWWLLFGWLILLSGFSGGRVVINRQERNTYMIVLLFLISELIIKITTSLFEIAIPRGISELFSIALPILPLIITTLPLNKDNVSMQSVDIIHALATATLLCALIFGSLLYTYLGGLDYLTALVVSMLAIAFFLIAFSWLLSPRAGFSGLSQLWSRALLNIGTPLENWLTGLSNLSQRLQTAEEILEASMDELNTLPWIKGLKWSTHASVGECGGTSKYETIFKSDDLTVIVYAYSWMGGALYIHCNLLIQLIENFYVAKLRERKLTHQTHLQAIYETGARVTHDIKNLLQSMHAITSIIDIEKDESTNKTVTQRMLEKQLPHLTQRLQLALDKLQAPGKEAKENIYLKDWWQDMKQRNYEININFESDISGDPIIPAELFDSVIENLLENIREKMLIEAGLSINISLYSDSGNMQLLIADNGSKISAEKAETLLKEPIQSDNGLGIGLFQASRHAESLGFSLELITNKNGKVCFELKKTNDGEDLN